MVLEEDIAKFLLISARMGSYFRDFIQFEDHLGFSSDPRWCLRLDAFMCYLKRFLILGE